jgi:hypothetical protein
MTSGRPVDDSVILSRTRRDRRFGPAPAGARRWEIRLRSGELAGWFWSSAAGSGFQPHLSPDPQTGTDALEYAGRVLEAGGDVDRFRPLYQVVAV